MTTPESLGAWEVLAFVVGPWGDIWTNTKSTVATRPSMVGGCRPWGDTCVGDPDVREDYDLGGTVV